MTDDKRAPNGDLLLPLRSGLFLRAHALASWAAILNGLLCGSAIATLVFQGSHHEHAIWAILLGLLVAMVTYAGLRPESPITACLVSARESVLEGQITGAECAQRRKKCLYRSLLY